MSFNKDLTTRTFFTLSQDSEANEENSLSECSVFTYANKKIIQELMMEIDLINEDRQRLKHENEKLRKKVKRTRFKDVQIELLSKIATKSLEQGYKTRAREICLSPMKKINYKIRIQSPAQGSPQRVANSFVIPSPGHFATDISSASTSPLKSNRTASSKIRVCRNYTKYPK